MKTYNKISLFLAIVVQIVVFGLLFASLKFQTFSHPISKGKAQNIVQAISVDQDKVQAEMQKIKTEQIAKKNAELARQKRLPEMILDLYRSWRGRNFWEFLPNVMPSSGLWPFKRNFSGSANLPSLPPWYPAPAPTC